MRIPETSRGKGRQINHCVNLSHSKRKVTMMESSRKGKQERRVEGRGTKEERWRKIEKERYR